jgi:hypothetical protein
MSTRGRLGEEATHGLGSRNPVTGTVPRHDRTGGARRDRMGRSAVLASRRDAVLRVLLEAYRRDIGPGAFDAH